MMQFGELGLRKEGQEEEEYLPLTQYLGVLGSVLSTITQTVIYYSRESYCRNKIMHIRKQNFRKIKGQNN